MRWQRTVRLALAVVGLGTAVVIYRSTRARPPVARPKTATVADSATTVQTGQGTDVRSKGDKQVWKLDYQSTRNYADGHVVRDGVHVTFDDGTDVLADHAEIRGTAAAGDAPQELSLAGHIRLKGTDNVLVQADTASYVDATKVVTMPGALTFARGAMSGTGTGGTYQRDTGRFQILADANVTMAPSNGGGKVNATAASMTYTRDEKLMNFQGQAKIGREAETLSADTALLHLADDEQSFTMIELQGNANVAPAPGKTSDLPAMRANNIQLNFYPGGQALQRALLMQQANMITTDADGPHSISATTITFATAPDGKTMTQLEGDTGVVVKTPKTSTAPERVISAPHLAATGNETKGLTDAVFSGGASFVENVAAADGKPASTRTGKSQNLTLKIEGQLDAIDEAHFIKSVKFTSDDVTGDADLGVYFASQNKLTLQPGPQSPKRLPHVTDGSMTVDASDHTTIFLDSQNLDAFGNVATLTAGQTSTTPAKDTGFFNSTDKTIGTADEFHYDDQAKTTHYLGKGTTPALVRQTDSTVSAMDVLVHTDTQDLTAKGSVRSEMPVADNSTSSDDTASKPPSEGAGSTTRAATKAPAGNNQASSSDKRSQPASGGTTTGTTTRYVTTSDTLVYDDATRTATYVGAPAVMTSADGVTRGTTIVLTLQPDSRTLNTLLATTNVYFKLTENGREGRGDSLLYETASNRYTLLGGPLALKSREDDGSCSLSYGSKVLFFRDIRAAEWPEMPGGFNTNSTKVSCADPLPPVK